MCIPSSRLNIPLCFLVNLLIFLFMHLFDFCILSKITLKSNDNFAKTRNLNVDIDQPARSHTFKIDWENDGIWGKYEFLKYTKVK